MAAFTDYKTKKAVNLQFLDCSTLAAASRLP
jgi:aminoglycoside phosphotransferase family enzyme